MISDESLMLEFQRGSREAFEELFARYRGPLYGYRCMMDGVVSVMLFALSNGPSLLLWLHDDVDRAFFGVRALDGERDALAFFADPYDDELPRALFARDAGRIENEALDARSDEFRVNDSEHRLSSDSSCIVTWACDVKM
jgi:hypothetical protein